MGFVNINGQQVHTSNIGVSASSIQQAYNTSTTSTITLTGTSSSYYSISSMKSTYHILGEDVVFDGYKDSNVAVIIATINVLGKPFYDELLKQNIHLSKDITAFLENKFLVLERDRKIDSVINDGGNEK